MAKDFNFIQFRIIKARNLKYLFERLDDEPRPFELVVHPQVANTRPVTIKTSCKEDADYFTDLLKRLSYGTDRTKQ